MLPFLLAASRPLSRYTQQKSLFCPCGQASPQVAGRCQRCYGRLWRSARFFSGLRDQILERDGRCCRACGARERLAIHHRAPGSNRSELLITLCAACHARIHRLRALRIWIPEPLVPLWIEQHPGVPVQLQLSTGSS